MKKPFILSLLLQITLSCAAQTKNETFTIPWPDNEVWKLLQEKEDSFTHTQIFIPSSENISTTKIIGVIKIMKGQTTKELSDIIRYYKHSVGKGTVITNIEKKEGAHRWVLFKVETPASTEYPIAESDLYYVLQGDYAIYEAHIATKAAKLDPSLQQAWTTIFKSAKLALD